MTAWTLITVTYQSSQVLRRYWSSPRPKDIEWIVIDNASTDDTCDVAHELGARVIRLPKNVGFSRANNIGLKAASGGYIGFINPDVQVKYEDLGQLGEILDQGEALIAPQLLNPDQSHQPNGRGAPVLVTKVRNRLFRSHGLNGTYLLPVTDGSTRSVWWATGAAILAKKPTIERLGGWNERYFLYHEDTDLCMRSWHAGIPVKIIGNALWEHGWARENASFRIKPIAREISSSAIFYASYPKLIFGGSRAHRSFRRIRETVSADWRKPD